MLFYKHAFQNRNEKDIIYIFSKYSLMSELTEDKLNLISTFCSHSIIKYCVAVICKVHSHTCSWIKDLN